MVDRACARTGAASRPRALLGVDVRTPLLWAVLLGAVALLAGFALSLVRKLKRAEGGQSGSR